jgi:microcystin-dependent protein
MSQPYVGEIRMFAGNFPPAGWAFCDGQLMPISENDTLFQLVGTTYGGDGEETFGIPNLSGRLALHQGTSSFGTTYQIGESAGVEEVILSINQIPNHTHTLLGATGNGTQSNPQNNVLASSTLVHSFSGETPDTAMAPQSVSSIGNNLPHTNMQPYLCVNYIISLFGIFPHT